MSETMRQAIRDGRILGEAKRTRARPDHCGRCGDYHAPAERCASMIGESDHA